MNRLRSAHIGPIVGHVTHDTARIWIRADDPHDTASEFALNRRTVGIIALRPLSSRGFRKSRVHYFRLQRERSRTGAFTFGESKGIGDARSSAPLLASTEYEIRVGVFTVEDLDPEADTIENAALARELPNPAVWKDALLLLPRDSSSATFATGPDPSHELTDLAFLVGSCRYPGLSWWKKKQADLIFGPMMHEVSGQTGRTPARMVLMVGDQIYADKLNRRIPIARADTFAEFQERYRTAFGSKRMRRLLRSVPTYMILDDHEIEDNWNEGRIRDESSRALFNLAMEAYMSYQWLHGPRNYGLRLFYDFNFHGYPFFVLDTRTQRYFDESSDLDENHLLGRPSLVSSEPSQLDLLLRWLVKQQKERGNVPKFIVSSSAFVPNRLSAREGRHGSADQVIKWKEHTDSWPAFPTTRRTLLSHIVGNEVQNVVFLSGDIHCSNVAHLFLCR